MELQAVLTSMGTIFTAVLGYAGEAVEFIVTNPICLLPVGIWVGHRAVGMVKGLIQGV